MKYSDARDYALKLFEDDLWIFEDETGDFHVIRGFAYDHYAMVNQWIPRAHVRLKAEVIEMWTGVLVEKGK